MHKAEEELIADLVRIKGCVPGVVVQQTWQADAYLIRLQYDAHCVKKGGLVQAKTLIRYGDFP